MHPERSSSKRKFQFKNKRDNTEDSSKHISDDVLMKPASGERKFWIYLHYKLSRHDKHPIRQVKKLIDQAMSSQRAQGTNYGLLFDIVTTSSTIASGLPHHIADQIYAYVEETHASKHGLKFVFVGITDNDNCRAARDVFSKEDISGHPKKPFDAIDNNHMYAVFPNDEEFTQRLVHRFQSENMSLLRQHASLHPKGSEGDPMMSLALSPLVIVNDIPEMHTMQKRQHATDLTDDPSPYPMLKRALNFSKATNSRRTEDQYKEVASPSLPVARPNSAINPLDCSPYMLEKPVSRIRNFEPIKKTLQPLQLTPGLSPAAQLYQVPDKPNFTAPRRLEASITRLEEILDGSTASQSFIDKAPRGFFVTQIDQQCQK